MTSVWTYDTAAHGIGKLASAGDHGRARHRLCAQRQPTTRSAARRRSRPRSTARPTTWARPTTRNSRLTQVSYPSGFTARYAYNSLGYANQLADHATSQAYWTANTMDAEQHLIAADRGQWPRHHPQLQAPPPAAQRRSPPAAADNAVQNLAYTYDLLGNPLSRTDANTSLSETLRL